MEQAQLGRSKYKDQIKTQVALQPTESVIIPIPIPIPTIVEEYRCG
jgi:hypothetical protein